MTWSARGYRSIIDYILTNKKLSPLVNYTKVFRGYDVSTDHYFLIYKICLHHKWQFNPITEHTWQDYYHKLWTKQFNDNTTDGKCAKSTENCVDLITMEELETTIKTLKSRKSPGSNGINNELYKHAPKRFFT